MELDTINVYSSAGMERELSSDPWDCLFGSDSISDAFQDHPDMFHMDIRRCDSIGRFGWSHGFDFGDVLTEAEDNPIGFNEKSYSSNSNLEDLHLDSDSELALTLDPNLILPRNMSMPIRSPVSNGEAAMLETASVEDVAGHEEEETENESEAERTENDEESGEEEEEVENEENELNRTEYETEEEETEDEEEEEEEEETEDDEQDGIAQRSLTPSSVEAPTSMSSSSAGGIATRTLTATSSPTIQLTRMQIQHPKMSTMSSTVKVHDIKVLAGSPGNQPSQHIRKQIYNNNLHDVSPGATTVMIQTKREKEPAVGHRDNPFPKPAYSYSCLIAMALKNSRTGSLPVSEIYNFMCRHFPYFTTAPNGWKNSVRHNLSLNKCFEKIEKPPGNGSQRKGCLWAIHPSKTAKMDEEVRKWSRKDPMAIKRAMVHPDHLELLERGEMKYEGDDRYDEMYEDAESYGGSETAGSAEDEPMNDEENVTYDDTKNDIDIVDDDIVVEHLYEDIDLVDAAELLDTRLSDFPKQEEPLVYEVVSCAKRQKTLSASQTDYVYQQVDASPRRKAHLVALRSGTAPGTGSFLESD